MCMFVCVCVCVCVCRYGVAPDNADVKKVMGKFEGVCAHARVTFVGGVHIGECI